MPTRTFRQREIASHHAKLLRPPSPDDVERWRRSRSWWKLAEIEALTADVMTEFGYERRTNAFADSALRAEARARHHLRAPLPAIKRNVEHVQRRLRKVRG